jgi:D-alanyl-lipoteichoic acid acyltransferase DltB (MBOAT superfamily)
VLFPTFQFGIFFPIVFVGSWLLRPRPRRWKLFLIAASYVFYAFAFKGHWTPWEGAPLVSDLDMAGFWKRWHYPALFALVTVLNQAVAVGIHESRARTARKVWVTVGVVGNLGVLGYFKYYNFFRDQIGGPFDALPAKQVLVPVAVSFYIFQALSYLIDTYREALRPYNLIDFACYLSFFSHLIAGPIVRASEFLPQLHLRPEPRNIDASLAFRLIVAGMVKKVVVADNLARWIVDPVFANPKGFDALENLVAVYAYAIQIYADFSGYTDIAIGLALLLGIRFPPNFDAPYRAFSLQDFWRRWHMTLSRWLRDYLYIPLGGNRRGELLTYVNLSLTMLLGGLWHGADWKFVVWGAIHGVGLALERFWRERRRVLGHDDVPTPLSRIGGWLLTFHVVCFAWIFFRASTFGLAGEMIDQIVGGWGFDNGSASLVTPGVLAVVALMLASQFVPEEATDGSVRWFSRLPVVAQGVTLAVAFFAIEHLRPKGVAPFIYFQF